MSLPRTSSTESRTWKLQQKTLKHKLVDGKLSTKEVTPPANCMRKKDLEMSSKRVQFDSTLFLARVEFRKYRVLLAQSN